VIYEPILSKLLVFTGAEHPRKYTFEDGSYEICPKNCTAGLEHAVNVTGANGGECKSTWPTILGSYWEWVWGPVGDAHPGVGYMHRPSSFPLVQFANESGEELCRNVEFPGRHIAKSLYDHQAIKKVYNRTAFSSEMDCL